MRFYEVALVEQGLNLTVSCTSLHPSIPDRHIFPPPHFCSFSSLFYCCIKLTNKYDCPLKAESPSISTKTAFFHEVYLCVLV